MGSTDQSLTSTVLPMDGCAERCGLVSTGPSVLPPRAELVLTGAGSTRPLHRCRARVLQSVCRHHGRWSATVGCSIWRHWDSPLKGQFFFKERHAPLRAITVGGGSPMSYPTLVGVATSQWPSSRVASRAPSCCCAVFAMTPKTPASGLRRSPQNIGTKGTRGATKYRANL